MPKNKDKALKQNLEEKASFQNIYTIFLLFREKGARPAINAIQDKLTQELGPVDLVADVDQSLCTFAVKGYPVSYKDGQMPAQLLMSDFNPFHQSKITPLERTQFWDCPQGNELLEQCGYELMLSDFLAAGLPYKERCTLLTRWVEIALELFPDCVAVWFAPSGRLLTREQVLDNPYEGEERFLYWGMNVRYFNIQGTGDALVDTLGLYAVGLPDVQYHFRELDPNQVVGHAHSVASYVFTQNAPIKSGETIAGCGEDGIDEKVKWRCQYEMSLIQPSREVMDVCPGRYAAGNRE